MQCAYHPDRDPVGACVSCGKLICIECKTQLGGKIYCSPCADKIFIQSGAAVQEPAKPHTASAPPPSPQYAAVAPPQQSQYAAPPPAATAPAPVTINVNAAPAAAGFVNNSGQGGGTTLPPEIHGWSWGAFCFSWLWGIFNSSFLTFLVLIVPFWQFVCGAKGKAWAWQNKRWDSIEHFKSAQKPWDLIGKILFFVSLAGGIIWVLILIVMAIIAITSGGSLDFGF